VKRIWLSDKGKIQQMFGAIAPRYDFLSGY
jgi:hypothetical protein